MSASPHSRSYALRADVAVVALALVACGVGTVDGGNGTPMPGSDPCNGVTCSAHGSCVASGSPAVAVCDCDDGFYAAGLTCLANDVSPVCATPVTTDSTYSGYAATVLDDGVVDARGGTATTWASSDGAGTAHFVELQFARTVSVSEVRLFWAWNATRSTYTTSQTLDVLYWNGSAFATAGTFTRSGAGAPVSTVTFAAVQTTRLRLEQAAGMGPTDYANVMWLAEIDYGPTASCLTSCAQR